MRQQARVHATRLCVYTRMHTVCGAERAGKKRIIPVFNICACMHYNSGAKRAYYPVFKCMRVHFSARSLARARVRVRCAVCVCVRTRARVKPK